MSKKIDCGTCPLRTTCTSPCAPVEQILREENRVMEIHTEHAIIVLPKAHEIQFSAVAPGRLKKRIDRHRFPWASEDYQLTKTKVFVERFFHKTPCKELAERFGVKENTIVCMYRDAVAQLRRILAALDARKEGLKATKGGRFNEDEKMFLLVCVFGFNRVEVAKMFHRHHSGVQKKVRRMEKRYAEQFAAAD